MDDTQHLIYEELMALRNDFKIYMEKMDSRVSSLEKFRDKAVGILMVIGVGAKCLWDYCTERIF